MMLHAVEHRKAKRERGNGLTSSLTLRVTVTLNDVKYSNTFAAVPRIVRTSVERRFRLVFTCNLLFHLWPLK